LLAVEVPVADYAIVGRYLKCEGARDLRADRGTNPRRERQRLPEREQQKPQQRAVDQSHNDTMRREYSGMAVFHFGVTDDASMERILGSLVPEKFLPRQLTA
jgi:hypothetical protein